MLFSSITFIYYFLPLFLLFYFIVPNKHKNKILLLFSLLFYFLGEPKYILILLLSCIINYVLSKFIYNNKYPRIILLLAIIYNVSQLLVFKYTDFFIDNLNNLFNLNLSFMYIVMPIGISFFTFQALSYVIDVYNKKYPPANSLLTFMTYICLFPQLIAGPIVRYSEVKSELDNRKITYNKFSLGIKRFIIGLSKKVLLANVLGEIVTKLVTVDLLSAWLKPILFTLQIYFDFSGYSDMAIGLGLMLGFKFLENFNYPFISSSITEFWRRWHISLSSWFKDYIYIPLGGSRVGKIKLIRNILIVWLLTGFWHGANWNFIIWGIYFGVFLIIEKLFLKKYLDKTKIIKYIYTIIVIIISFLIFNETSVSKIIFSLKNMFNINNIPLTTNLTMYYLKSNLVLIIISIVSSTPIMRIIINNINKTKIKKIISILEPFVYLILLTLVTAFLIDDSFNPFLYFRF